MTDTKIFRETVANFASCGLSPMSWLDHTSFLKTSSKEYEEGVLLLLARNRS